MNEIKITKVSLDRLKPLEHNVRKHNEKQIEELVRSVDQFGQTRAIVIDEGYNILIGNGLYYALQRMGVDEAQCYIMPGLSEVEKKKLILADNQIYKLGADDYDEIRNYINDITITGDFEIAGFDEYVLENMTAKDEELDEMMNDYGKVTEAKYVETAGGASGSSDPEPQKKAVIVTEEEVAPVARKSVVCPSCGEVIYIG